MQVTPVRCALRPALTTVITAFNEGHHLSETVESISADRTQFIEMLLVDDGSTDDSCRFNRCLDSLRVLRNQSRKGVAYSRHVASMESNGQVIAYFDGHQSLTDNCLQPCAELAYNRNCIVCPDICDFQDDTRLHGAYFTQKFKRGAFSAEWKLRTPRHEISEVSSLKAPTYFLSKSLYPKLKWSTLLQGWGGSEACLSLKAFFTGVPILHLCGPLVRHKFKQQFHYDVTWSEVWRNHAIIARVCFDESTWYRYWLPEVFEPHLTTEAKMVLESDEIKLEQSEFAKFKVRSDREFWTRLIFQKLPSVLE